MGRIKDIAGQRFGNWTVQRFNAVHLSNAMWQCKCDCGAVRVLAGCALRSGGTKSCGCTAQDQPHRFVHGAAQQTGYREPEYGVWCGIKARCLNPKSKYYSRYGGRGITVSDRWLKGENGVSAYDCFLTDMGRRPTNKHQIEREDNDKGYSKENCTWATKTEQMRNRCNTILVEVEGRNISLPEACERLNLNIKRMYSRLSMGWSFQRASTEPAHWRGR
jgi:hypothetical protein